MDFEWDRAKSERDESERGLPFELAALLFDGPTIESADERRHYGETRIRAIGVAGNLTLHCVYTQRGEVRRIISLRYAKRKEGMPIVRRTRADIDKAKVLAKLATRPQPSEEEIEAQTIEDGDAWTSEELADAEPVYPPPSPDQVRALRAKLGLTQAQFARRFGFTLDTVQQYEQGRRRPSGPASTLLRVIEAAPEAVVRALRVCKAS